MPIERGWWSGACAFYMAGIASMVFALCSGVVEVGEPRRWSRFLAIYGMNALAVFIFTGVIGRLLGVIKIGEQPLEVWIFETLFAPLASPINASLLYAIVNVFFYFLIVYIMYRRGWFLRV